MRGTFFAKQRVFLWNKRIYSFWNLKKIFHWNPPDKKCKNTQQRYAREKRERESKKNSEKLQFQIDFTIDFKIFFVSANKKIRASVKITARHNYIIIKESCTNTDCIKKILETTTKKYWAASCLMVTQNKERTCTVKSVLFRLAAVANLKLDLYSFTHAQRVLSYHHIYHVAATQI